MTQGEAAAAALLLYMGEQFTTLPLRGIEKRIKLNKRKSVTVKCGILLCTYVSHVTYICIVYIHIP